MAKITNPEKECKKTPERFSEESRITSVETSDCTRGIVLDSPDEFARALIVYNGGSVEGAKATQNKLIEDVSADGGGMAAGILLLGGALMAGKRDPLGFTFEDKLAQKAIQELRDQGRFHRSFDYDAMGTNFFKTTVEGNKVGDKYVLGLCAAYVGTAPEGKLAQTLGKPMALVSSSAKGRLSVVDDWWFNVNLESVLGNLPIPANWHKRDYKATLGDWAKYIASGGYEGTTPKFEFEHNGKNFNLTFGLEADRYLKPEDGERGSYYMQSRGGYVVGGAWTTWAEDGNIRIAPKVVRPAFVVTVSFPGESYSRPPAVKPEEVKAIREARDYLAALLPVSK